MSNCRSGCATQNHATWGECARAARIQIDPDLSGGDRKRTDKRLDSYAQAKSLGLQPPSTKLADTQATMRAAGA